ncbi:MAG: HYR domain-containing protein, partial [Bacteroidales bacterium]|nr:HYR domain-containing protein [Bacteroidales bacterium]
DAPAVFPIGNTTVTWTVTDGSGNIATCEQIVTVTDIELPTIVCPAPVAVNTDADECTASGVDLGTPTVDDNCSILSVTNDAPAVFPIGSTTVTWTVTDGSGNIATCEQIVTVTDIELPTIVCPAPVAVNTDADECTASGVDLGTPTVDDNCSILSVTNDAPAVFPIGNTTVTWTVTDGSGNIATCEQIVTVTDIELPTIVCPAPIAVNTDADECTASGVVLGTPTVDDNCSILSVTNDAPAVFPIGNTTVTWTVTDGSGNIATCEQIVTVTDIELPTIVCPAPVAVNTDADECTASGVVLGTPTVDDNCSILSVTNDAPAVFPIGNTTVTWTVTDGSGNIATCEQIVTVTDIELPTIVCPEDIVSCSNVIELVEPQVSDNCGIDLISNNAPAVFPTGTTTVTWTVTDVNGNISTCDQLVHVSLMDVAVDASTQVSCTDASDAVISVAVEGAFGEVTYSLNGGTPQSSSTFEGLSAGEYTVLVVDENGCSFLTDVITIDNPTQIDAQIILSSQVSCFDGNDASIEVLATGGTGILFYSLNGGEPQLTNTFTGLSAGLYEVVVTDENGCSVSVEGFVIENPEELEASVEISQSDCYAGDDATVTVSAFGGTGYYTYTLNSGIPQSESTFIGLTSGSYTLLVTDSNGCTFTTDFVIGGPELLTMTYLPHCRTGEVGIDIFGAGGTAPYQYSIDGGVNFASTGNFEGLTNGTNIYLVVTDANGCTTQAVEVPVESLNTLSATVSVINHNNCEGINDAVVEVNVSGGVEPYLFTVNGTDVTASNIINNLAPGDNVITIRDSNGCPAQTEAEIFAAEPIAFELISKTNADCNGNNDGTAEIEVVGGTEPYIYEWANGSNQSVVADLGAGTHTVTVTDINGCEKTYDIVIDSEQISETPKLNNVFTPNNDGQNDYLVFGNLELFPENELVVFNRWGNEVYSRASYNNLWDGSNLSEGTYFYILKVKMCDEYKTFDGYITILR